MTTPADPDDVSDPVEPQPNVGCDIAKRWPNWSDTDREAALEGYAILDTEREQAFDDIAELAAELLDAPIAVVNFVTSERQWFKAELGIGTRELPLDVSICRHAILQPGLFVVPDLTLDKRFEANPLVHVVDGLRFYAGALLRTSDGVPLGTLCVLDTKARPDGLTERQARALEMLASQTMAQLELRRETARAERHSRRLTQLSAASAHLVAAADAPSMIQGAFAAVAKVLSLDVCFQYRCGENELKLVVAVGLTEAQEQQANRLDFGQTICGLVAERREPMHVNGIQTSDDPDSQFLRMLGIDTYLSIPLVVRGELTGTLSFGRRSSAFTSGEIEVLTTLAAQAATALERQMSDDALREREDRARFLLRLEENLRAARSPHEAIALACETLGMELEATSAGISEVEDNGEFAVVQSQWRAEDSSSVLGRHRISSFRRDGLAGLHAGNTIAIGDVTTHETTSGADTAPAHAALGIRGLLDTPLLIDGKLAAVLFVIDAQPRNWTARDIELSQQTLERAWSAVQRARAEDALHAAEARATRILDTMGEGFALFDHEFRLLDINREALRLDARTREEMLGKTYWELFSGTEESEIGRLYKQALAQQVSTSLEHHYIWPDGNHAWLEMRAYPVEEGLALFYRDVSDRKNAERELIERDAEFRTMADNVSQLAWMTDPAGSIFWYNQRWYDFTGSTLPEMKGWGWSKVHHPDYVDGVIKRFSATLAAGEEWEDVFPIRRHDGEYRWFLSRALPIRDETGEIVRWFGTNTDITEQRETEQALAASEAQFRTTAESLPGLLFVTSNDGQNIYVNDGYCHYTGLAGEELLGDRWVGVLHKDDASVAKVIWAEAVETGKPYSAEYRFRRHDGDWRWHLVRGLPIRGEDGAITRWVGTCIDIHDRRELESELQRRVAQEVDARQRALEQLHEVHKTETIGQLSSGIAHDFNNLLTPIVGALDLLQRKYDDDPRSIRMISGAQQSAERARVLISRLLTFARRQHLEARPVDIGVLTEGLIDMISRTIGPQIEICVDMADELPPAQVDPNQFELALLNLCVNARDAMPGGGTLTIASDWVDQDDSDTAVLARGTYVRVCVTDTGHGMDAETLRRATEPFYSTKGVGKGTGLGLSMVQGLAAQSGGATHIVSAPDEGTTITIWLPAAPDAATPVATAIGNVEIPDCPPRRILLVDDEELVLGGNADMLEALGHEVTRASSGAAALAHLRSEAIFDLLLTDHMMPSMTGAELIASARILYPRLPVALITGFTDDAVADLDVRRLSKPFRLADIAKLVIELSGQLPTPADLPHSVESAI